MMRRKMEKYTRRNGPARFSYSDSGDRHWRISLLLLCLVISMISGCHRSRPYQIESEVSQKLFEFSRKGPKGASIQLKDITSFSWGTVYFFLEGTKKMEINQTIGQKYFAKQEEYYSEPGPLMIFTLNNEVVHAIALLPPLHFSGNGNKQGFSMESAKITAYSKDPGPYMLEINR